MSDWQLDRLPGDVRLEAENAAQRDGLPLHRWLGKMIRDTCAAEGVAPSRELSRASTNGATGFPRRPISTIATQAARDVVRAMPQPRAADPPRAPEWQPVVNGANGLHRTVNGHAAAATPAPQPAAAPPPDAAPAVEPLNTVEPPLQAEAPRAAVPESMPEPMPAAAAEPMPVPPPKQSTQAQRPPLGRPPMPTMPPPPPAPTISRFTAEPGPIPARLRPEPAAATAAPSQQPPIQQPPAQQPAARQSSAPPVASPPISPTDHSSRGDDRLTALARLMRSLQRNELSPIAEARLYLKLMTEHMASISDLTAATGRTRDQVTRALRLLGLSDRLRELIDRGALSREQAFALLDTEDPEATNPVVPPSAMGQRLQ